MSVQQRRRGPRRILAASALLTAVTAAVAFSGTGPASAYSPSISTSVVDSGCSSQTSKYRWSGDVTPGLGYPTGLVYVCFSKLKWLSSDSRADYYSVVLQSYWTFDGNRQGNKAPMGQSVTSNLGTLDNVYSATGSWTSNKSCTTPVSLSVGYGPFSISTSPQICSGYKTTRSTYSSTGASWSSTQAGGLSKVETVLNQKVAKGQNPKYTVRFSIPTYYYVSAPAPDYVKAVPRDHVVTFYTR